jgi:hypothetical protein
MALNKYIGQTKDDVVSHYGVPDRYVQMQDGIEVLEYRTEKVVGSSIPIYGMNVSSAENKVEKTIFIISNGTVKNVSFVKN